MTGVQLIHEVFRRNGTPECKSTNITMVKIVMLMCYFSFGTIVFVMAFLLGKLFCQMLIAMKRLKQYRKQYCKSQRKIEYKLFHRLQR
jgi:hypothetical protein